MCTMCGDLEPSKRDRTGKICFAKSDIDCVVVRKFKTLLRQQNSDYDGRTCAHYIILRPTT